MNWLWCGVLIGLISLAVVLARFVPSKETALLAQGEPEPKPPGWLTWRRAYRWGGHFMLIGGSLALTWFLVLPLWAASDQVRLGPNSDDLVAVNIGGLSDEWMALPADTPSEFTASAYWYYDAPGSGAAYTGYVDTRESARLFVSVGPFASGVRPAVSLLLARPSMVGECTDEDSGAALELVTDSRPPQSLLSLYEDDFAGVPELGAVASITAWPHEVGSGGLLYVNMSCDVDPSLLVSSAGSDVVLAPPPVWFIGETAGSTDSPTPQASGWTSWYGTVDYVLTATSLAPANNIRVPSEYDADVPSTSLNWGTSTGSFDASRANFFASRADLPLVARFTNLTLEQEASRVTLWGGIAIGVVSSILIYLLTIPLRASGKQRVISSSKES